MHGGGGGGGGGGLCRGRVWRMEDWTMMQRKSREAGMLEEGQVLEISVAAIQ